MTTLLVVDDDEGIQKFLGLFLKKHGFDIITAYDGDEALKVYNRSNPDIVILDLIMPKKEGIETILDIKKSNPDAKVIAISGGGKNDGMLYLEMAKKMGAVSAFEKPLNKEKLLATINEISASL